jgi:hypothetical protein
MPKIPSPPNRGSVRSIRVKGWEGWKREHWVKLTSRKSGASGNEICSGFTRSDIGITSELLSAPKDDERRKADLKIRMSDPVDTDCSNSTQSTMLNSKTHPKTCIRRITQIDRNRNHWLLSMAHASVLPIKTTNLQVENMHPKCICETVENTSLVETKWHNTNLFAHRHYRYCNPPINNDASFVLSFDR